MGPTLLQPWRVATASGRGTRNRASLEWYCSSTGKPVFWPLPSQQLLEQSVKYASLCWIHLSRVFCQVSFNHVEPIHTSSIHNTAWQWAPCAIHSFHENNLPFVLEQIAWLLPCRLLRNQTSGQQFFSPQITEIPVTPHHNSEPLKLFSAQLSFVYSAQAPDLLVLYHFTVIPLSQII